MSNTTHTCEEKENMQRAMKEMNLAHITNCFNLACLERERKKRTTTARISKWKRYMKFFFSTTNKLIVRTNLVELFR